MNWRQRRKLWLSRCLNSLFLNSLIICLCLGNLPSSASQNVISRIISEQVTDLMLVQQGIDRYHAGDLRGAIDRWQQSLKLYRTAQKPASQQIEVLKYLARAYQQVGQVDQAIAYFEQIITHYRQTSDTLQLGRMLTEQAQAYSDLGQYRRAIALLCGEGSDNQKCAPNSALAVARQQSDALGEAAALGSLGNVYSLQGDYDLALELLRESQAIATRLPNSSYVIAILNTFGNVYTSLAQRDYRYIQFAQQARNQQQVQRFRQRAERHDQEAMTAFETSLNLARSQTDKMGEIQALLGLTLPYSRHPKTATQIEPLFQQVQAALKFLPSSHEKAVALIKLVTLMEWVHADTTIPLARYACLASEPPPQVTILLQQARAIAHTIQDRETESFAIGTLGHLAECTNHYAEATELTNQAQLIAVTEETRYLWEWQAGRIFKAQWESEGMHSQSGRDRAIATYTQAINTVRKIQGDIATANRDLRLDFQETVESVYRQLVEFRLKQAEQSTTETEQQTQLTLALEALDGLRLTELQNYLGSPCELPLIEQSVTAINTQTAVFNTILLDDRVAIILTLPERSGKPIRLHWVPVGKTAASEIINDFRQRLEQRTDRENIFKANAQELYNWFIRPFAADLEQQPIKALVFIQDGMLRTIPMATLHDGKQFLIQRYAIANTSSLSLSRLRRLDGQQLQVSAFGLTASAATDENTFFAPLAEVKAEIERIKTVIPGSEGWLDREFTRQRLQQELQENSRPVLHLATHARFGFDAKETFLVTGGIAEGGSSSHRYNEILSMNELYQTIRRTQSDRPQLELLTLTGCETAVGSDRDALGMAGVAVQAGAQSAIASLWRVEDQATATLITQFYQHLRNGLSKAEALQATQAAWLAANPTGRYSHPGYWAPFILIGSWF